MTRLVVDLIACPRILTEIERALKKRYFATRCTPAERADLVETLRLLAIMPPDPADAPSLIRDGDDDFLVALARSARADAIASGDADLLDHDGLQPPALHARAACELLGLL